MLIIGAEEVPLLGHTMHAPEEKGDADASDGWDEGYESEWRPSHCNNVIIAINK